MHTTGPINFDFSSIPFVGRHDELSFLFEKYRLASSAAGPEVVFVSGEEGIGKTALVNELKEHVTGYFVSGCCSRFSPAEPYEALLCIFDALCDLLLANDEVLAVRHELNMSLREETAVLSSWLPNLNKILGNSDLPKFCPDQYDWECKEEWAFGRLKYSLRAFLRCICSPVRPVVIFLDNLDVMDDESLEIISNILMDHKLDGLLFIGANRPVDEEHRLNKAIKQIEKRNNGVSRVTVRNLPSSMVNRIVSTVTACCEDTCLQITESITRVANGNPFYSIESLKFMHHNHSSSFDETWTLADSVDKMSIASQDILRMSAHLGKTFGVESVRALVYNETRDDGAWEDVVRRGFIRESLTNTEQNEFSHQIYKEIAISSLPGCSPLCHLQIGRELQRVHGNDSTNAWTLQLATEHLNLASTLLNQVEMEQLARMNLVIAKRNIQQCSMRFALKSLKAGLHLLKGNQAWTSNYILKLELSTLHAKVSYSLGMLPECYTMIQNILFNAQDIMHKIPAFFLWLEALGAERRLLTGMEVGIGMLKDLGEKICSQPGNLYLIREAIRVKAILRGKSDDDLMRIPPATNEMAFARARLASDLSSFAYQGAMPEMTLLLCIRMVHMVIRDGLTPYSPFAFACYGLICGWSGDFDKAYRFGCLAEKMLDVVGTKGCSARTMTITQSFLIHLKKSTVGSMAPLRLAWRTGLETGDLHFAQFASNAFVILAFFTGRPLSVFLENYASFRSDSSTYKQQLARHVVVPYYQATINLTSGTCRDPIRLTGRAMNEDSSLAFAVAHKDEMTTGAIVLTKLALSCLFGDWESAGALSDKITARPRNVDGCNVYVCPMLFFLGLASIKRLECRKFRRRSRQILKELESWERRGAGQSCTHYRLLLKAEQSAVKAGEEDHGLVKKLYEIAIEAALQGHFLNIAALGCELAGCYFQARDDESLASFYFRQAFALYDQWGAITKCEYLKDEHGSLLGSVSGPYPGGKFSHSVHLPPNARLLCLGADIYMLEQQTSSSGG